MSEFFTQVECVPICSIKTLETILHNLGIKNVYQSDYLVGSKLLGKLDVDKCYRSVNKTDAAFTTNLGLKNRLCCLNQLLCSWN